MITTAPQARQFEFLHAQRQLALDTISDFAYVFDLEGRFTFVNKPLLQLWGLSLDQAIGKNFFELNYPADLAAKLAAQIKTVIHTREKIVDETSYTSPTGVDGYYQYIFTPVVDDDDAVCAVTGITRNISELKRIEDALRQSREQMEIVVKESNVGVWYCPLPFDFLIWDDKVKEHFHLAHDDEVTIDVFYDHIHPDDRERTRAAINASLAQRLPYDINYRTISADGSSIKHIRACGRAFFDSTGKPTRFDGITIDVTQRENLLASESAARAEAENANRAKDHFLAVLSHELRTPLSPIVMALPEIENDPDLPPQFKGRLAMLRRNIDLEVRLIDDLLDLSRVTSGKLRLQLLPVHIHNVLRHALETTQPDAAAKNLHIATEFTATTDLATADSARLQQVFWNLLRNAIKFTPDGGQVTLTTANTTGGQIQVCITDTGIGIPPAALARVFDAFEQGDVRVTHKFGGLGLGLAIARSVVEIHGGTIAASSPGLNQGATFTVTLPTIRLPAAIPATTPSTPNASTDSTTPLRILLVEDHPDTASTMARILHHCGFQVQVAHSVAAALQTAAAERFDIVVSDIGLPDATGYDLMQQLRAHSPIRGIALSGYGMEEDVRKSHEAGFTEHLVKPVNIAQLESIIRRMTQP